MYCSNLIYNFSITILLIILFIIIYLKYSYNYWRNKRIPYIDPVFPFGNVEPIVFERVCFGKHVESIYKDIKAKCKNYGGFFMVSTPMFMAINPELIKNILNRDFDNFQGRGIYYDEASDPLSGHLINLHGNKWKKIRTKMTPNFTAKKMKMMFQNFLSCSEELDNIIEISKNNKEPIDILDIMARFTIDNICSSSFGIECNSLKNPNVDFRKYGQLFMDTTFSDAKWIIFAQYFPSVMKFFKIPLINREVTKFFLTFFKQNIDYREKTNIHREDFIDLFIKLRRKTSNKEDYDNEDTLSINELAAQAFAVFMAGYETSAVTLTCCMSELAVNQHIQDKVRDEINRVLEKHGGEITYEAVMEMTYMEKVINETLRKNPVVSILNRECEKDYMIPGTNTIIPKGILCVISVLGIHMDPDYYPDPEKFDPERFSEEEKGKRHPFNFLPFGEGPRTCIGQRFAIIQIKIGLSKLLKNTKYFLHPKTTNPFQLKPRGLTLSPKETIWLQTEHI